jgi:hypothetical protein
MLFGSFAISVNRLPQSGYPTRRVSTTERPELSLYPGSGAQTTLSVGLSNPIMLSLWRAEGLGLRLPGCRQTAPTWTWSHWLVGNFRASQIQGGSRSLPCISFGAGTRY